MKKKSNCYIGYRDFFFFLVFRSPKESSPSCVIWEKSGSEKSRSSPTIGCQPNKGKTFGPNDPLYKMCPQLAFGTDTVCKAKSQR